VHYPGLKSHPQHALAAAQMQDFGTIVTFDLKGGAAAARHLADALELFALAASLGSTESLVVTAQMMSARELTADERRTSAVTEGTVRLSIGLEDIDDLLADLASALEVAQD
jgi:cystathionine beta-lyase/cystathionine gamma-synthase